MLAVSPQTNFSEAEIKELALKVAADPNSAVMTQNYNALLVKFKLAASNEARRVQLEQAMKSKDYNQLLLALEMTDAEYKEIGANMTKAMLALKKNLGVSFDKLAAVHKKYQCQSCEKATDADKISAMAQADFVPTSAEIIQKIQDKKAANSQSHDGYYCHWYWMLLIPVFSGLCLIGFTAGAVLFVTSYWWISPSQQQEILNLLNLPNCVVAMVDYLCRLP